MKKLLYIMLLAITPFFFIQCDSEDDLVTENAKEGGLFEALTPYLNYVVGDGKAYSFSFQVYQSPDIKATSVEIYKSCFKVAVAWSDPGDLTHTTADSIPAIWSNEVLQETITITNDENHVISTTALDYAALIADLTIDGDPLPASDGEMRIGDYFNFRIVTKLDDGRTVEQSIQNTLTVSTRFAGTYKSIGGAYYHPDYNPAPYLSDLWLGETVIIFSIDAMTYRWEEWGILSGWSGNVLYFQINPSTGKITYPEKWAGADQILNNLPLLTAERTPGSLTYAIPAAGTNIDTAIKDDVEGKDQLNMVFGYLGASGSREFFILLEKVVN